MSAPGLASDLEQRWRRLPSQCWGPLGFLFLDRTLRDYLARCFQQAGHASVAELLSGAPSIENADSWRRTLDVLQAIPEVRTSRDTRLLAAFFYVTANLPASLLDQSSDTFLKEVSTVALVLCNMSTGSFNVEFEAQREDLATLESP